MKRHSQTSCLTHINFTLIEYSRFSRWKRVIDSSGSISFFAFIFPFIVFPYMKIMYWVALATYFSPLLLLPCYNQVATIFMFTSDCSLERLFLKHLRSSEKKLLVEIVVHKPQETILYGPRDVRLDTLHAVLAPTFRGWPELIQIITLKHSKLTAGVVLESKICEKDFHSSYLMREHLRKEHGTQRGSRTQSVDFAQLIGDVDEKSF